MKMIKVESNLCEVEFYHSTDRINYSFFLNEHHVSIILSYLTQFTSRDELSQVHLMHQITMKK